MTGFLTYLIENIGELASKVVDFFMYIIEALMTAIDALGTFYELLVDFDHRILLMSNSAGASEFTGMPIVEAIGTFRYLVGDVAFYMIYLTVLFGCLMTIWKLVSLLFEGIDAIVQKVAGVSSKTAITNFLGNIFK